MLQINKCFLCGSKNFKFLYYNTDRLYGVPGQFRIEQCNKCKIIFLNPQPKNSELEKYYPNMYYSFDKIKTEDNRKIKLKLLLYKLNYYKNRKLLKLLLLPIRKFVRTADLKKTNKILDVGCGSGQFLYEMKRLGIIDCYGVEPYGFDEKGAKKHNLNIKKCDLLSAKYPSNFFDIITLNHVLEHMSNPDKILKEIKRILKVGGKLIIEVPNANSLNYAVYGKRWYNLDTPRHLYSYSDKNLHIYLESLGFDITSIKYKGNTLNLGSLDSIFTEMGFKLFIKARKKIMHAVAFINVFLFDKILSILNWGDSMEIVVVKNG
jgi:ubiquinone/menaquinone biosynthesis C-methylase UbiE